MIIGVNLVGATTGLYYVITYAYISGPTINVKRSIGAALAILYSMLTWSYFAMDFERNTYVVGMVSSGFSIALFASPLVVVMEVLKSQSTASMDFKQSLLGVICAFAWFSYGIILQDSFVQIPNFMGFALGLVQLMLFKAFPN